MHPLSARDLDEQLVSWLVYIERTATEWILSTDGAKLRERQRDERVKLSIDVLRKVCIGICLGFGLGLGRWGQGSLKRRKL